ncbi:DUF4040 domain-containing protein [Roseomonas sp. NAR14]|uniref:DUF4040 domain-containing protein n=1 Tax=Roseomonas acroporae TaxID=2937791 RepID=A0A9X1Y8T3_9PROT|nr:MnhB domain-containing protein [Roseomonas acroporae]MCK8786244.1 DUF4040 domain-containing protein [Roseomonas acroporae]
MTGALLDLLLAGAALGAAAWSVAAADDRRALLAFLGYGLLLALAWTRLGAVDVALTEAAIGALSAVLLLGAVARLPAGPAPGAPPPPGPVRRAVAGILCATVSLALMAAILLLPSPAPSLARPAAEGLPALGLGNPVTAVLIGYRALDTLLEKVVLLLALVGVWSLAPDAAWGGRPWAGRPWAGRPWHGAAPDGSLVLLARLLPPIGILLGIHLVWVGAEAPGGTFQGGTVLAAMLLLAAMAGLVELPRTGSRGLRWLLAAGPAVFFAVGLAGYALAGSFLAYPETVAKPLILLIEFALTPSLAVLLALLLAGPAEPPRGAR